MAHRLPGKFVWFEHLSADPATAQRFYDALFGWRSEEVSMGDAAYPMIHAGEQGIGGYRQIEPDVPSLWMGYISVSDVDAAHAAAVTAGARSLLPPTEFGPAGRGAAVADPTGAVVSMWQGHDDDPADVDPPPAGHWCWAELWTLDEAAALAFYERVFGYTREAMNMGEQGTYYLLKAGGASRAGVFRTTDPAMPTMWLPYVAVDDCDASAEKARALGATVTMPPTDIPNIGRFAVLIDPLGATVAVLQDKMQR